MVNVAHQTHKYTFADFTKTTTGYSLAPNVHYVKTVAELQDFLNQSLNNKDEKALRQLAKHELVTNQMLQTLLDIKGLRDVHAIIASNQKISLKQQTQLVDEYFDEPSYISPLPQLAANKNIKVKIKERLAELRNPDIISLLIYNQPHEKLVNKIFVQTCVDKTIKFDADNVLNLAANPLLSNENMDFLLCHAKQLFKTNRATKRYPALLSKLSLNPTLTSSQVKQIFDETLSLISESGRESYVEVNTIRAHLARYGNCSPEIFEQLFDEADNKYRICVNLTQNPYLPTFMMKKIVSGTKSADLSGTSLMQYITQHSNTSNEILEYIVTNFNRRGIRSGAVQELYNRNVFGDFPQEWIEAQYGVSLY